jgi:electron transport complex protein RnfD
MNLLKISGSPHVHGDDSVRKIMMIVIIAMLPAMLGSFYLFGIGAIKVMAVSIIACVLVEYLIQRFLIKGQNTLRDNSAILTGILLAFNVPSNLPIHIIIIGAIAAIGVGKMTFGGLGKNIFNPALVGRVILLISFPVEMTSWPKPIESARQLTDVVTGPTPLAIMKGGLSQGKTVTEVFAQSDMPGYVDFLTGNMGGSVGEVSALLLLMGAVVMLLKRVITWHTPLSFIAGVVLLSGILWLINPELYVDPLFHLLTGGLVLGIFYMATDMVTSPMAPTGQLIFGFGCGILTILIRVFGAYPEGVSFAILIMNAFVPLINNSFKPKKFGGQ